MKIRSIRIRVSTPDFHSGNRSSNLLWTTIVRVGEVVSQQTHNLQVSGSSPLPATKGINFSTGSNPVRSGLAVWPDNI